MGFVYFYKYTGVYSKRLWYVRTGMWALVLMHVVLVNMIVQKGYLALDEPEGLVRFTLEKMVPSNTDSAERYDYCREEGVTCAEWDKFDVSFGAGVDEFCVTTSVKQTHEKLVTDPADGRTGWVAYAREHARIAGIEEFWLKIEHSFVAPDHFRNSKGAEFALSQRRMQGKLVAQNGTTLRHFNPGAPDKIPIGLLMEAVGIQLDSESDRYVRPLLGAPKGKNLRLNTFRDRGLVVFLTITYENTLESWFGTTVPTYTISARVVPETEFSQSHVLYSDFTFSDDSFNERLIHGNSAGQALREVRKRKGIHISAVQAGQLGMFSYDALLSNVVSGMGLLAATAAVLELLALYVLPRRKLYTKAMIDEVMADSIASENKIQ